MLLFISGAEIVFVFFIILLVFGADKIPSIARTLAKGMTQVRRATNDIKSEIQKTVDVDIENPSKTIICTYARQPRLFVPLQNKNGYYLRCLLPDELKQIQGFPEDYKISGDKNKKIIQIGNAVPPPLIKLIVESLVII